MDSKQTEESFVVVVVILLNFVFPHGVSHPCNCIHCPTLLSTYSNISYRCSSSFHFQLTLEHKVAELIQSSAKVLSLWSVRIIF